MMWIRSGRGLASRDAVDECMIDGRWTAAAGR